VIEAIYEGNDLQDTLRGFRLEEGDPAKEPGEGEVGNRTVNGSPDDARAPMKRLLDALGTRNFWLGSSALLQYTYPSLEETLSRWGWVPPTIPANRMLALCLSRAPHPLVNLGVSKVFTSLAEIEAICESHDARLVILMIPSVLQADPARFQEFLDSQSDHDGIRYDRTSFHERLVAGLRDAGYLVVDPLQLLEAATRAGERAYHREGHFDLDGHRIVADALVPVLREVLADR
jgi:hypothetical protein